MRAGISSFTGAICALILTIVSGYAWMPAEEITSADFSHDGNRFTIHATNEDDGTVSFRIHVYCNEVNAKDGYTASVTVADKGRTVFKSLITEKGPIDRDRKDGIVFRFKIAPQYLREAGFNLMFQSHGYWAYLKHFVDNNDRPKTGGDLEQGEASEP